MGQNTPRASTYVCTFFYFYEEGDALSAPKLLLKIETIYWKQTTTFWWVDRWSISLRHHSRALQPSHRLPSVKFPTMSEIAAMIHRHSSSYAVVQKTFLLSLEWLSVKSEPILKISDIRRTCEKKLTRRIVHFANATPDNVIALPCEMHRTRSPDQRNV